MNQSKAKQRICPLPRLRVFRAAALLLVSLSFFANGFSAQGKGEKAERTDKSEKNERGEKGDVDKAKLAFIQATCWSCHPRGENSINGDRPLKGPGFLRRYPDDESLAEFIRKGAEDKGMPSFPADRLSDRNLSLVISYIRSLTPPAR
ncbi:MAG: cytochrome c [Candidatus Melainabacteria bacterium]|nr:cytochrome c [Candidatus Melainabacteria bacterium]